MLHQHVLTPAGHARTAASRNSQLLLAGWCSTNAIQQLGESRPHRANSQETYGNQSRNFAKPMESIGFFQVQEFLLTTLPPLRRFRNVSRRPWLSETFSLAWLQRGAPPVRSCEEVSPLNKAADHICMERTPSSTVIPETNLQISYCLYITYIHSIFTYSDIQIYQVM